MILSATGLALIKEFEGCKLTAYQDERGIWTIGYGHTGPEVVQGLVWSQAQADAQLASDVATRAAGPVSRLVLVALRQGQFDALTSLCFNIGQGQFAHSTLLRLLNACSDAAAAQFLVWDKVDGRDDPGLLRRRSAEQALFLAHSATE